jgi:hypothetical protein
MATKLIDIEYETTLTFSDSASLAHVIALLKTIDKKLGIRVDINFTMPNNGDWDVNPIRGTLQLNQF